MTEKDDNLVPKALSLKLQDPGKFSITCTIGGMEIPRALCDLGSSINVIPPDKVKECDLGEIIPSNITLALVYSSVTHTIGVIQDMLVHVDDLVFPEDFMVLDMKGNSEDLVIL
ncbi:uncharacterized protein LOC127079816 [Lathyrus oleraceus]|uniref:uncharacterized protein LOC127079816 n=1 Tax=Pisum sativum TaxID=3888 RepID=UPI0021D3D0A1|nr:uncharacterized protein LOC127079816 [Pisum sativum]